MVTHQKNDAYEPSAAINIYTGSCRHWERVAEWDKYIHDPLENKNGHIIT